MPDVARCVYAPPPPLLQVRLPLLPVEFLTGTVAKDEMIKGSLNCRDLMDEARNYHLHLSNKVVQDFEYSARTIPRKQTAGSAFMVAFTINTQIPRHDIMQVIYWLKASLFLGGLYLTEVYILPLIICTSPGVLFCVGGRGGSGDPFRSIECYSITKNSWFFGPEMNSRRRHVGVISVGGKSGVFYHGTGSESLILKRIPPCRQVIEYKCIYESQPSDWLFDGLLCR